MNKSFNLYNYLKLQAMVMTFCLSKQQKKKILTNIFSYKFGCSQWLQSFNWMWILRNPTLYICKIFRRSKFNNYVINQTYFKGFYKEFKLQAVQWHIQNQIYPKGLPLCTAAKRGPNQLNVNHHIATIQLNEALPPNKKIN